MKISCVMITTNIPSRFNAFEKAIDSVDRCNNSLLDGKTLSVDVFNEYKFDKSYFKKYEERGWIIVEGACSGHRGMVNNIIRGLNNIDKSDYVLYVEDDIIITKLPKRETVSMLRDIAFVCFNTHVSSSDGDFTVDKQDFVNEIENYKVINNEVFLIKGPQLKDEYFINFPVAIAKTDIFNSMIRYACHNIKGVGLEPGMTRAWFDLKMDRKYNVGVYFKDKVLKSFPVNRTLLYQLANMRYWNNDANVRTPSINDRKNTIF